MEQLSLKRCLLVIITALCCVSFIAVFPGQYAMASVNDPVTILRKSQDPVKTLDKMSMEQKHEILKYIDHSSDKEVNNLFFGKDIGSNKTQLQSYPASGYYDRYFASAKEKVACVIQVGISGCKQGAKDANTASNTAARYFKSSLHNGKGDAFRHCYWNALMTHHIGIHNAEI